MTAAGVVAEYNVFHRGHAWQLEELRRQLEQREEARILDALEQLQEWNADCVGICRRTGMKRPRGWAEQRENWETVFPLLTAEAQVQAKLEGGVL